MSKSVVKRIRQAQEEVAATKAHKRLRELHLQALRLNLEVPVQLRESSAKRISWSEHRARYMESNSSYGAADTRQVNGLALTLRNAIEKHQAAHNAPKSRLSDRRRERVS